MLNPVAVFNSRYGASPFTTVINTSSPATSPGGQKLTAAPRIPVSRTASTRALASQTQNGIHSTKAPTLPSFDRPGIHMQNRANAAAPANARPTPGLTCRWAARALRVC